MKNKKKRKELVHIFCLGLSQEILLPSQIPGFIDQPDIWKKSVKFFK